MAGEADTLKALCVHESCSVRRFSCFRQYSPQMSCCGSQGWAPEQAQPLNHKVPR